MTRRRSPSEYCADGCGLSKNYGRYCRTHAINRGLIDVCVVPACTRAKSNSGSPALPAGRPSSYCRWHNIGLDLTDPSWFDWVAVQRFWACHPVGRELTPLEWKIVSEKAAKLGLEEKAMEARFGVPRTRVRAWNRYVRKYVTA